MFNKIMCDTCGCVVGFTTSTSESERIEMMCSKCYIKWYRQCQHRHYCGNYYSYSKLISHWTLKIFGKWRTISFFGFLKQCDVCKKRMVRLTSWKPPIKPNYGWVDGVFTLINTDNSME